MLKILAIIWMHWFADFCLQSDKVACGKSKSHKILATHCLIYGIPMAVFGWEFALLNTMAHFVVDGVSSRIASAFFAKGERHWFFVVVGFDQVIHMTILLASAKWLGVI